MIYSQKIYPAINFILGYKYYLINKKIIKSALYVKGSKNIYQKLEKSGIFDLALAPSKRSQNVKNFSSDPLIEVLNNNWKDSIYFSIENNSDEFSLKNMTFRKSDLKTEDDIENKLRNLLFNIYESSLISDEKSYESAFDAKLYKSFFKDAYSVLINDPVFWTKEFSDIIQKDKLQLILALISYSGIGSFALHNGLGGIKITRNAKNNQNKYSLKELSNQYLYKVFR